MKICITFIQAENGVTQRISPYRHMEEAFSLLKKLKYSIGMERIRMAKPAIFIGKVPPTWTL